VASLATEFTKSKTTAKSEPNGLATGIYWLVAFVLIYLNYLARYY
jgi:hypothetical protein